MKKFISLSNIIFILISLDLLLLSICTDCSNTKCNSDGLKCENKDSDNICDGSCKPKYQNTKCYHCNNIANQYYHIVLSEDDGYNCHNTCQVCEGTDNKNIIIGDSNECICINEDDFNSNGLYNMGNVYYSSCPQNSSPKTYSNECKCDYYYYIETINENLEVYTCLGEDEVIPSNYKFYNDETKQFYKNSCPDGFPLKKKVTINDREVTRCSMNCRTKEFKKIAEEGITLEEDCIDDCNIPNVIYEDGPSKQCLSICPDGLYEKIGYCISLNNCNFFFGKKCLDSCHSEESNHEYHNYNEKECINHCEEDGDYKYKDESNKICYKDEHCNYINEEEKKCLSSCGIGEGFINPGYKICYSSCPGTYFHNYDSNICMINCIDIDKIYHKDSDYTCYSS